MRATINLIFKIIGVKFGDKYLIMALSRSNSLLVLLLVTDMGCIENKLRNNAGLQSTNFMSRWPRRMNKGGYTYIPEERPTSAHTGRFYTPPAYKKRWIWRDFSQLNSIESSNIEEQPANCVSSTPEEKRPPRRDLTNADLAKIPIQLKNTTTSQMQTYLRAAELWKGGIESRLSKIFHGC